MLCIKLDHTTMVETMQRMEENGNHVRRRKGGTRTMPFIFGNDISEKLAVVGFAANMQSYLTTQLNMSLTQAANTLTNFGGTASLTPLIGAFIADAYVGKFWTITVSSMIYQIGMTLLTISAILPQLKPSPCKNNEVCEQASSGQLSVLYVSLLLTAIGAGGIRPCVVAFGADQYDETDPKQKNKTWKFFNWYYFAMGSAILVAVTVLVYLQDNVGWGWGLGVPTVAMFISIIVFIIGYPLYRNMNPVGSPFTRLVQVGVAAFKKRKLMGSEPKFLYDNEELDEGISAAGKLLHSDELKFLDKAAMVTGRDDVKSPNLWSLNTVHRVEELKCIIRMGPIWASGIILYTAYAQQSTFSLQQAKTVDRHLGNSFEIPAASMTVFTISSMLATIVVYDRLVVPITRQFTGLDRGITFLQRMGIGLFISVLATLIAGLVEVRRKQVAAAHGLMNDPTKIIPISFLWLAPQYCLHGVAEAFMAIGHLEFFYDQAPESMRSTSTAMFWCSISAGNYLSTLVVSLVHKYTAGPNGSNWLPNRNINKGKLEYFYWLLTGMQFLNLIYYICCAQLYTLKSLQIHKKENSDKTVEEVELSSHV